MKNISYIGLSRQVALWDLMQKTAHNMANVNTTGYKSQKTQFSEYINPTSDKSPINYISQVQNVADFNDFSQGQIKKTNNDLDMAINGDGYFAIQTGSGTQYTRDGSFQLNNRGELVTSSGQAVMGEGGAVLKVQENASQITISPNGNVSTEYGEIGKIKVVKFDEQDKLVPTGSNLFAAGEGAREQTVLKADIEQGALEMSNVEPISEMNNMIQIQRMFEATQTLLNNDHDMQRSTIRTLTQV